MDGKMTKSERSELGQLIRKRERLMKAQVAERSSAMMAEFETQCSAIYSFDQDGIWTEAMAAAEKVAEKSAKIIEDRCKELGIPKEFAPSLNVHWYSRGEGAVKSRRIELRLTARARIAACEKKAIAQIERMSLEAQTEVIANGLVSEAALSFLERMPTLESLMPALDATEIKQINEAKSEGFKTEGYGK